MMEASGWDYICNDEDNQSLNGIYKDENRIFEGNFKSTHSNRVNLRISNDFIKDELTDEDLTLSKYGLSFSIKELNLSYIDSLRNTALEAAHDFEHYKGIDFFGDTIVDDFLNIIDEDLLFDFDYQED